MPNLPEKKAGIVACSGEEMPEGFVSRLAALQVLEERRPGQTVTICLPLFLAGGEGDRAFARFYPTITIDGCDQRCAARATELYSHRPAASFVVSDFVQTHGLPAPRGLRRLDADDQQVVTALATAVADKVDELLAVHWSRRLGEVIDLVPAPKVTSEAACACGSGIPVTTVEVEGQIVQFMALNAIFDQAYAQGLRASAGVPPQLLETVRLYNPVPAGQEALYAAALTLAWTEYGTRRDA